MNIDDLEQTVSTLGLKITLAMLADICQSKARMNATYLGDMKGLALDWQQDATAIRQTIRRIKNP